MLKSPYRVRPFDVPNARNLNQNELGASMKLLQVIGYTATCCAAALLAACGSAAASNFGTYTADGKTIPLNSGYAWTIRGDKNTKVVMCDVAKIDAEPLNAIDGYRYNAFYTQVSKTNPARGCVELKITPDGSLDDLTTNTMNGMHMGVAGNSRPAAYKLEIKRNDGKRIEGTLHSTDELKKSKNVEFDIKFNLDVAPTPSQN